MKIVVLAKVAPDYEVPLADFELTNNRAVGRYTRMMGMYDENAVEVAIQLKEKLGLQVTVISYGQEEDVTVLRKALAMGGDDLTLVVGRSDDPRIIAENLNVAVRKNGPIDLILAGRQCSDIERGLIPGLLAQKLGLPFINQAAAVTADGAGWLINQSTENGSRDLALTGPAVLSITSNEKNVPRIPAVKEIFVAKKKKVTVLTELEVPAMAAEELSTAVVKLESHCEFLPVEDMATTARLLLQRLKEERYL